MHIRDAVHSDIGAITDIYNDAVIHSTAIWNDETVDTTNRSAWFDARKAADFPVIVAVNESDAVVAYATFGDWRAWDGYKHTVSTRSMYIRTSNVVGSECSL